MLLSGLQELWGKTIYDKFFGEDIWFALTNVLACDTVYTLKKGAADGREMRPSNDFQRELKKHELRFNCCGGVWRAGSVRAEKAATQFDEAALFQRDS